MTAPRVDPSNVDQFGDWDGPGGAFWADHADHINRGVAGYQPHLLAAAAVEPAARVLDVGCGSGQTTRDLARAATAGSALGVDLSARMLALADRIARAEGLANVRFEQADAQVHPFPDAHFDLVASRHGAMFFGDAPAAFTNLARALRPGGRLVLLSWQPMPRNEWLTEFRRALAAGRDLPPRPATPGSLTDPDQVRALLTAAGFTDVRVRALSEPMWFGADADDATRFVSQQFGGLLTGLDPDTRVRALADLRASAAAHQTADGVRFDSAAWLTEARRP
jgi:SAM-dependent methyltransferase